MVETGLMSQDTTQKPSNWSIGCPHFFLIFLISISVNALFFRVLIIPHLLIFGTWAALVIYQASWRYKSILVGDLALLTSILQLSGYGLGFIYELFKKGVKG